MPRTIISEGKTTNEAVDAGLKQLNLPKEAVEIKVLEDEEKRSFFSILTPRIVKVELTVKEKYEKQHSSHREPAKEIRHIDADSESIKKATNNVDHFLKEWKESLPIKELRYDVFIENDYLRINITGEDVNYLIGYRGDVLNSLQVILSSVANKGIDEKIRVLVDVEQYRLKREKTLEELSDKLAKTVVRTGKQITLEPMTAYERKIIHTRLQDHSKVKTESIGEEPYRKVIISLK